MPLTTPQNPVISRILNLDGSLNLTPDYFGLFNIVNVSSGLFLSLSQASTAQPNAECIIRNPSSSAGNITIIEVGVSIDVSGDLGFVIQPGGIGELKRRGTSSVWDFYGYITA
jgi:hypothetical protein